MSVAEPRTPTTRGPMVPVPYRVVERIDEFDDTVTLRMVPDGDALPRPRPGQFNMLWAFGIGEAPISVAGVEDETLVHTVRAVGAVTRSLCAAGPGTVIGARGPFGVGWDMDAARGGDVLVIGGGLGIAPVRPIVTEVLDCREDYGRLTVLLGARSPVSLLYDDDLAGWRSRHDVDAEITVDVADRSWSGEVGLVTRLVEQRSFDGDRTTAFVCGPEVMMRFAALAAVDRGVDPARVHLSLERNMHCAIGHCGHCQLGPAFVCKDGPVLSWTRAEPLMRVRER